MTRINQLIEIVNYEGKLKGSLNSSFVVFLQQQMIRNYQKKKKKEKGDQRIVNLKQLV